MAKSFEDILDVIGNKSATLKKGERVTLQFVSNPSKYIRASQIAIIEWRLGANKSIEIISANYWGVDTISFDLEVTSSEALLNERMIIGFIMSANPAYFYLAHKPAIDKIPEKVAKTVTKTIETIADYTPLTIIVAIVAGVLYLTRK